MLAESAGGFSRAKRRATQGGRVMFSANSPVSRRSTTRGSSKFADFLAVFADRTPSVQAFKHVLNNQSELGHWNN
jgi:hypothetical protein